MGIFGLMRGKKEGLKISQEEKNNKSDRPWFYQETRTPIVKIIIIHEDQDVTNSVL